MDQERVTLTFGKTASVCQKLGLLNVMRDASCVREAKNASVGHLDASRITHHGGYYSSIDS